MIPFCSFTLSSMTYFNSNIVADDNNNRRFRRKQQREEFGDTLCKAVKSQNTATVEKLLSQPNANPDARSPYGWCALHIAVANNDKKMVKLLLDSGADVNIHDMVNPYVGSIRQTEFSDKIHVNAPTQGFTPLHYAVALLNEEMIALLCSYGADPDELDARKLTPINYLDKRLPQAVKITDIMNESREKYLQNKEKIDRDRRLKFPIEDRLKERIVGQLMPINSVASAIRRKLNGWHDEDHPLVFLFLGSSGVGKTELAKTLANILHKENRNAFIRIDMSEFQHKHEVAKFIGSPPGYVGHEQGGQLTSRLKENPNAIVLLDEVEKAHPDVLTIMLQLFDEGRITDGKGETIECKDAIFVMTSNLAQTEIADEAESLRHEAQKRFENKQNNSENKETRIIDEGITLSRQFVEETIQPILKTHFQRDEFLGRINEILYFLPFNELELKQLILRELNKWKRIAYERHGINLSWDDNVIDLLRDGYNIRYGARSIQHEVEKRIVNQMASIHEKGTINKNSKVHLTTDNHTNSIVLQCSNDDQSLFSKIWKKNDENDTNSKVEQTVKDENQKENKKTWLW